MRSGVLQSTFWYNSHPADVSQTTLALKVSGTQLVRMTICGYEENSDIGATRATGFTVSGNTWRSIWPNPYHSGLGSYEEIGQEWTFTRQ